MNIFMDHAQSHRHVKNMTTSQFDNNPDIQIEITF